MLLNLKSEKQKRAGLIAEIKYWKFSILKFSFDNNLFKQRGLSIEQLSSNLRTLLKRSPIMVACDVTLDDLDSVIAAAGEQVQVEEDEREDDDTHCETEEQEPLNVLSPGPATSLNLSLSEHVAVNIEQGFYIGEIIELIDAEYVKISYIWLLKRFI